MQTRSKLWYLENFNLREILTLDERRKVAGTAEMQHIPKKGILYFATDPSDSIYILKEGLIKISRFTPDGHEIILSVIQAGEIFGEMAITGQKEREETAEVLEDAVVCVIRLEDIKDLMKSIPSLNTEILKRLGARVKKIQNRLDNMICKNTKQRIRALLREMAEEHGRVIAGDPLQVELKLSLTHADIAKLTASCRQSVSMILGKLEKQGLIKYDRKRIYIKDLSQL